MTSATATYSHSLSGWKSHAASAVLHAALFVIGAIAITQPAQFGVSQGEGGAAGASSIQAEIRWTPEPRIQTQAPVQVAPAPPPVPTAEPLVLQKPALTEPAPAPIPAVAPAAAAPVAHAVAKSRPAARAHSSTASAGSASGTGSGNGARVSAKPNYRRNPPPAYPAAARQRGEQGLVVLMVRVNACGRVDSLRLSNSSGHALLDSAALAAVRRWQFYPATAAGVPVASSVVVPVRFRLEQS